MKVENGGRAGWLPLALVAVTAASIQATTIAQRGIETNLIVWNGKVMFVQPGSGLTILDVTTGRVLLRDTAERRARSLVPTASGVLLCGWDAAHEDAPAVWMVDIKRSLLAAKPIIAWSGPGGRPQPAADKIFDSDGQTVFARRALDGSVVWGYLVPGSLNWSKLTSAGVWAVEGQVALVSAVTLLDPSTGRVLGQRKSFQDREFVFQSLEANRFVAWAKAQPSDRCQGRVLRILTFSPERGTLTAAEGCREPLPSDTTFQDGTATCDGFPTNHPRLRSCALVNPSGVEGLPHPGGPALNLQAITGIMEHAQRGWQLSPRQSANTRIWFQSDFLFLSHSDWEVGVVERIDLASGKPVWRYVFPSSPIIASTNRFFPPLSAPAGPDRDKWERIMSSRVQGSVRVQPPEAGKPTPVIFDPAPALASRW